MKRAALAFAGTMIALAVALGVPDRTPASVPSTRPPDAVTPVPSGSALTAPLWRLDIPKVGGPFAARLSPNGRAVALESASARTGAALYEIQPPAPPSDVAHLRLLVRLDRVANPIQWLPDSSGLLVYEPDGPSSTTGVMSLVGSDAGTMRKRWSIATTALNSVYGAKFSADGRYAAFWLDPHGTLVVALDGTKTYALATDVDEQLAGWDAEGNVLFHAWTANALNARALDARVAYTVPLGEDLRNLSAGIPSVPQPPDRELLWFDSGRGAPGAHATRVLFDRKVHEIPAELEDLRLSIGEGPWRGHELITRRKADSELVWFDPRTGATRALGVKLSANETIWGLSGDYFAVGRRIVQLSTSREQEITAAPWSTFITALGSGRFALSRDGITEILDAAAWMAAPQSWTGELPPSPDQTGVPPDWVRVRGDDGGFTIARPLSWSAFQGRGLGAVLSSGGLLPSALPTGDDVRIEIALDIAGPRGPADFLDGLGHHGSGFIERRTVQLPVGTAEFAIVYDNTQYPKPTTSLNWALRSPYLPDRVVWIRAWPLDSGRRAEVDAVVATLRFVAPR
jgi:hypothetical protein